MLVLLSFLISRLIYRSGLRISHSKVFSSTLPHPNPLNIAPENIVLQIIPFLELIYTLSRNVPNQHR